MGRKQPNERVLACAILVAWFGVAACTSERDGPAVNKAPPVASALPAVAPEAAEPERAKPAPHAGPRPSIPTLGQLAPEIVGEDIDGKPIKLSDYHGKVVMLDFWGHW